MAEWIKTLVLRAMKLPAEPHAPLGSEGSVRVFRAGRNYLRWSVIVWAFSHLFLFASVVAIDFALESVVLRLPPWGQIAVRAFEFLGLATLVALWIISWFQIKLNYELRWYIVTDRSLRIRCGIVNVQELTMTFANIQEVRVSSNPLQLILGLADVEVHTAGGGSGSPGIRGGHAGRFQGVDNAAEIRDFIVERLRAYRDSGLGGPVEAHAAQPGGALEAAQEVLAETRALRAALTA